MIHQPEESKDSSPGTRHADLQCECLYRDWPDRHAIRFFIAQQIETDVAHRLNLPLPSRGDDPTLADSEMDCAWPELDQTLRAAMEQWDYPDELLDMLEDEARRCADYVLAQASGSQKRELEAAAVAALTKDPLPDSG